VSSGKSELASNLSVRLHAPILRTRDLILGRLSSRHSKDRQGLQRAGDRLDRLTGSQWIADDIGRLVRDFHTGEKCLIVDSIRVGPQIQRLREAFGPIVTHIHLTAPLSVLAERFSARSSSDENSNYEAVRRNATERSVNSLGDIADIVIDTNRCTSRDVATRATASLNRGTRLTSGYVDVLIGGQFGSEGKGQITAFLSKEYDLLVRVGGPNAGHRVFGQPESITHHLLPSGTTKSDSKLLIGPGAVLRVQTLLEEIARCEVDAERLGIDGGAIIIEDSDINDEGELRNGIGSTGQGVGIATARRIQNRLPHNLPRFARDVEDLKPYICDSVERVSDTIAIGGRVLLEGTQGTGLSLYHGTYPFVTSRDTTVAACLSDAGIAPAHVRKVTMACRTYPIRVESPNDRSRYVSEPFSNVNRIVGYIFDM